MDKNIKKAYFPGKYIQAAGAIKELPELIGLYGGRGYFLLTPSMEKTVTEGNIVKDGMARVFRGECCWQEMDKLEKECADFKATVVIGVGGGKILDCAKVVADKLHLPVIMVPTVAATNAASSACAVIYTPEGIFESVYYETDSPNAILVDSKIIADAPAKFLIAGMGDAFATWFEALGCLRTESPNSVYGRQTNIAMLIARACYENLLVYGEAAALAAEQHVVTPALERIIETNILYSGIGFESGGLAAAHAIHNGFTIFPETHVYYHGIKVALGVLAELHLTDAEPALLDEAYDFCRKVGLPTTLVEIGLQDLTYEDIYKIAVFAHEDPYMCHDGAAITPEQIAAAIIMADKMGRVYKQPIV